MRIGWLAVLSLLFGCQSSDSFGCSEDGQCESAGITGMCEANGYCSFLDDTCASGRRYGDLAGGGLAAVCVQEDPGSTGAVSTTNASGTSSTGEVPTTSSASSGAVETGGFSCEPLGVCSDDPLPGWSGPIVLEPAGRGACQDSDPLWTAGTGLVPESACDCACEGTAEVQCQFDGYTDAECDGLESQIYPSPDNCKDLSPFSNFESITSHPIENGTEDGYCSPPAPLSAALDQVFAACDPTSLGRCEDGTPCIEESPDAAVCDWRDGIHDCPSPQDQRTVLYRGATGGYDCGCECGAPSPCSTLLVYVDAECSDAPFEFSVSQSPECTTLDPDLATENLYLQIPSAQCEDLGSRNTAEPLESDQEPTEIDPVTLCCR